MIQVPFANRLESRLVEGGTLELSTDWSDYAQQMLKVLDTTSGLINCAGYGNFAERPTNRKVTRFEQRGRRLGHAVFDLQFRQTAKNRKNDV